MTDPQKIMRMINMQKMKMPIIASVIIITLVATGLLMGTLTYFSATNSSGSNTFAAGTMELLVTGDLGVGFDNMAPGDTVSGGILVTNDGSLDGYLYGRASYTITYNPGGVGDLGDVLNVISWKEPYLAAFNPGINLRQLVDQVGPITIGSTGEWMSYGSLPVGASVNFAMTIQFATGAGNEYQGDVLDFGFELYLSQINLG